MNHRDADLKRLRWILDGQAEYKKQRAKRKLLESRMPSDYVCSQCKEYKGGMAKDWRINQDDLILCSQCDSKNKEENNNWNVLDSKARIELVFNLIYKHELVFRRLCKFDEEIFDNAVIDRIENFITNYDPTRCLLYTYLRNAVGWYALKASNIRNRLHSREIKESDIGDVEAASVIVCQSYVDDQIPVFELLESLHPFDAWLIEQHIINGWSQEELAKKAKRSKATINVWIAKVCDKLRREWVS